jgi:hypothetical protein
VLPKFVRLHRETRESIPGKPAPLWRKRLLRPEKKSYASADNTFGNISRDHNPDGKSLPTSSTITFAATP